MVHYIKEEVRSRYAEAASGVMDATKAPDEACCGGGDGRFGSTLYSVADRSGLPVAAVEASLGCGDPLGVTDLGFGETVLDLGSGGGIDVLLSAKKIGPSGKVYGLDMTDEMLELARRNAAEADVSNVEFLKGEMESIPLPDGAVDVVISNCVINLSTDKGRVLAEIHRVLKPGGRIQVSDVVAEDHVSLDERAERGDWAGCIAGALSVGEYRSGLTAVGLTAVEIQLTHEVAAGMHAAVITAVKPV